MTLEELTALSKKDLETWFMDNARYMPDAPSRPYFIRCSSKVFFSDDTMDLRKQFEEAIQKLKRKLRRNANPLSKT